MEPVGCLFLILAFVALIADIFDRVTSPISSGIERESKPNKAWQLFNRYPDFFIWKLENKYSKVNEYWDTSSVIEKKAKTNKFISKCVSVLQASPSKGQFLNIWDEITSYDFGIGQGSIDLASIEFEIDRTEKLAKEVVLVKQHGKYVGKPKYPQTPEEQKNFDLGSQFMKSGNANWQGISGGKKCKQCGYFHFRKVCPKCGYIEF